MDTLFDECECDQAGQVGRENGDDVGFETPLPSHHIGIGTKLCRRFQFSVALYFLSNQTQVNSMMVHNTYKQH